MSTKISASLGARYENSKTLVSAIKKYSDYDPTSGDIQAGTYEQFLETVDDQMIPYKNAYGALINTAAENRATFENMILTARKVRSEIAEVKGKKSSEYNQVNSIVKLITGQNVRDHSIIKIKALKENKKDNEPPQEFNSVSQLDYENRLDNFKSLTALLRSYSFYDPKDADIKIAGLESTENALTRSLENIAEKENTFTVERSRIIHLFEGSGGTADRARRAKMHVSRKYGHGSPEYKALVNKKY